MSAVRVAVVSMRPTVAMARATVAHARAAMPAAELLVLDVDGSYRQLGAETVLTPDQVGLTDARLHRMAAALSPRALEHALYPALLRAIASQHDDGQTMLAVRPGVLPLAAPTAMLEAARAEGVCVVARAPGPLPDDGRWPGDADVVRAGAYAPSLLALHGGSDLLTLWETPAASTDDPRESWLDLAVERIPHGVLRGPADLLTAWNLSAASTITATAGGGLRLDGQDVVAVDLSRLDPAHPWLLDAATDGDPRGRLSEHPALAELVERYSAGVLADIAQMGEPAAGSWNITTTSLGIEVDAPLRELFGSLRDDEPAPDPFDPAAADHLLRWLTEPERTGSPARYLMAIHPTRPDLGLAFPAVPGADTAAFLAWAGRYALSDGYPAALVEPALAHAARSSGRAHHHRPSRPAHAPGRPPLAHGVNVVGYLRGEFGIGESARLMVTALQAAGVPHSTVSVDQDVLGRQRPEHAEVDTRRGWQAFDTSLICVNADLTPALAASIPRLLAPTFRIGMWYWEVEDFPAQQHSGFAHVDEVWVATEFIRAAIEPHSPVPVRIVAPPLPQRGAEPTLTRADLGLPNRPYFLFSFDFLSTAERKNAVGLVDAFTSAFRPGEGPVLVVKSINANQRAAEAERLRLRAAGEPDVVLMEDYLDATGRDALIARCACYVSLHRSEGLGLTMAEAMAWGKPVIATGYSGNLDFMTEDNSFLVPWAPTTIPPDAAPYPAGGTWAQPDLAEAARLMRMVVDQPEVAASRGAQAAMDIATLHSPEVAGRAIAARLAQVADRPRSHRRLRSLLRDTVRAGRATLG